jgi:uncharacterized damage-inducible protein DinB
MLTRRHALAPGLVLIAALAVPGTASAQDRLTAGARTQFNNIHGLVARTAEKIPEDLYSFRATPEVRSVVELLGHITDSYFSICATANAAKPPRAGIEKSVKTKGEMIKALIEGAAYCESVFGAMNDKKGVETVQFFFGPSPKLSVLYFVTTHAYEHYGNLVTYMRLKGIVPPSSEPKPAK